MLLKPGDKLIFVQGAAGVSWRRGNVFTFSNKVALWDGLSVQFEELHDQGNHVHNAPIKSVELFDPAVHKEFRMMDAAGLQRDVDEFNETYG